MDLVRQVLLPDLAGDVPCGGEEDRRRRQPLLPVDEVEPSVLPRLGETGDVRAIVEQSDGTLWQIKREVKVTVGGCGG